MLILDHERTPKSGDADSVTRCDQCAAVVDTGEWHPAGIAGEQGGETVLLTFCGRDCRDRWQQRDSNADAGEYE